MASPSLGLPLPPPTPAQEHILRTVRGRRGLALSLVGTRSLEPGACPRAKNTLGGSAGHAPLRAFPANTSSGSPSPAEAGRGGRENPAPSPNDVQGPRAFPSDLGRTELRPPRPPACSTRRIRAPSGWNPAHLCSLDSDTEGVSGPPPTEAQRRPTPPAPSSAGVAAGSA